MSLKSQVFAFLKSYSSDPHTINRLLVSSFLYSKKIFQVNNILIGELLITPQDADYNELQAFIKIQEMEDFEQLIEAFEFVISPEEKIVTGAVYTPTFVREFIVNKTISAVPIDDISVCDPACGCAGFLYTAALQLKVKTQKQFIEIFRENLFGLDIQEYSVSRSRILLSLAAIVDGEDIKEFVFNIWQGNALNFQWANAIEGFVGFSAIVGNPPYVASRNIDEESKTLITNWEVCSTGHPDLYIPFFEIGMTLLRQGGILGYITMNTFFKSVNGRALREYFERNAFKIQIIDFGGLQIFQSKSTYTCICLIENRPGEGIAYVRMNSINTDICAINSFTHIPYVSLISKDGWNLQEIDTLNKIEFTGLRFGNCYRTRNGIATLKNDVFIFIPETEDERYYYLKRDGIRFPIERAICRDIINSNKLTKPVALDSLRKKIIFPYIYEGDKIILISEAFFTDHFPQAYRYLGSQRELLSTRDKGNGNYENWYAYGRNQSLERFAYKLFFPHISPTIPSYEVSEDQDLLFYNGLAVVGDNQRNLLLLKKLMSSRLFWFYITNSSKPYGSGYFSLSRNYLKNFGIYQFSEGEIDRLIAMDDKEANDFIEEKYHVHL